MNSSAARSVKTPATAKTATKTASQAAGKSTLAHKAPKKVAAKPSTTPVKKTATPAAENPLAKTPVKTATPKVVKVKLVRDSFTIPSDEYAVLGQLKQRALGFAHPAKKSELLRAGIKLLAGLNDAALMRALKNVPTIKTGRPKSKKGA